MPIAISAFVSGAYTLWYMYGSLLAPWLPHSHAHRASAEVADGVWLTSAGHSLLGGSVSFM